MIGHKQKKEKIGKCQISKKVKNMIGHKQKNGKKQEIVKYRKGQKHDRS